MALINCYNVSFTIRTTMYLLCTILLWRVLYHYDVSYSVMTCSLSRGAFDHDFSVIPLFQFTAENLRRESSDHAGVLDVNHPHSGRGSAVVSVSSVLVPVIRDMRLGARGSDGRMCCGLVSAVAMIRCARPVSPPGVLICDSFSLSFRLRSNE